MPAQNTRHADGSPPRGGSGRSRCAGLMRGLLPLLVTASAQATSPATPATPAVPAVPAVPAKAATADAAVLYHNYCSVCHGDKGDGRSRAAGSLSTMPRDFTSAASRAELTRERIAAVVAHGKAGTAMVGWKTQLSTADIERLADYVHARFVLGQAPVTAGAISGTHAHGGREADRNAPATAPATASTSVRVDTTAGLPNGLKGDTRRGGAFYMANCATCHGARGDGAGPRAYFINPKPRNFVDAAWRSRVNRVVLYAAVSEGRLGTEMPAWSKVATPQQMADVAEYVFQIFVVPR